ncbi:hypothetical protein Avbf_14767 [Armadillidium vulgare]|nr:hypothetical protein Avbf_14767 [Armadillidium vulgare]
MVKYKKCSKFTHKEHCMGSQVDLKRKLSSFLFLKTLNLSKREQYNLYAVEAVDINCVCISAYIINIDELGSWPFTTTNTFNFKINDSNHLVTVFHEIIKNFKISPWRILNCLYLVTLKNQQFLDQQIHILTYHYNK